MEPNFGDPQVTQSDPAFDFNLPLLRTNPRAAPRDS
jgi:hypothetical protein